MTNGRLRVARSVLPFLLVVLAPAASRAVFIAETFDLAFGQCAGSDIYPASGAEFALGLSSVSWNTDCLMDPSDPLRGLSGFAGSVSSANLRTGTLSSFATVDGAGSILPSINVAMAAGQARFFDLVTVSGPTASFATTVGLNLHVAGSITGSGFVSWTINNSGLIQAAGCVQTYAQGCTQLVSPEGPFAIDVPLRLPVSSESPSFQFFAALAATAVNSGVADASNTASLSIELPEGFSFTSESGVLLVPEPSSLALLATGLVGLAACARSGARTASTRPPWLKSASQVFPKPS